MQKSVLIKVFKKISKPDLRKLRKFVRSPYYNKRTDVIALFDYLVENIEKKAARLDRTEVFAAVYPDRSFSMQDLRYVQSFLLSTIKEFLNVKHFEADTLTFQKTHLTAMRSIQSAEDFEDSLETAFLKLEEQKLRNSDYYSASCDWHRKKLTELVNQRHFDKAIMQKMVLDDTSLTILNTLKLAIIRVTLEGFSSDKVDVPFLSTALELALSAPYKQIPAVAIYFHLYSCFTAEDEGPHFQKLKELLPTHIGIFPEKEQGEIFFSTINFCIKRFNRGHSDYMAEVFHLYRLGLDNEAIMDDGFLSRYSYHNILLTSIHQKNYDWAFNFLSQYKAYLPEDEREAAYTYNLAILHSYQKNYDEALELFQKITAIQDPLYNLDARRMLVKIFYETDALQAVASQLDNYRAYIRRHNEIGYHSKHHKNFINVMRKLIMGNLQKSKTIEKLYKEVQEQKAIAEKGWLLEQIEKLR